MLSRIFRIPDSKPSLSSKVEHQNVLAMFLDRNTAHESSKTLIGGPHGSGKTSLLFSLAITFAEEGKYVLFICPRKVSTLPVLPEGEQRPSTSTLQKIHMVYLESKDEFLKYMASIHLNIDKTFHCMIVDNLDSYVAGIGKNEELTVMARLLAFTVDAYNFELEKLKKDNENTTSMLVVSITVETNTIPIPRQNLYERWIDYILRVKPRKDSKSGDRYFELSLLPPQSKQVLTPTMTVSRVFINKLNYAFKQKVTLAMKRIVIKLTSPSEENLLRERVRVTTPDRFSPMKELSFGNGELRIAEEEHRAVSPTKTENQPAKIQTTGQRDVSTEDRNNELNDLKSAEEMLVISEGIEDSSPLKTYCKHCGKTVELNEFESELNATRKELEAKKLEIEEIKTKLEDELFERLGIEDEFTSERETQEREVADLRERNQELEGETLWKIEELENNFRALTNKHENAKEEIGHLKVMLERTVAENVKLRNKESVTDDRVLDILDDLQMWKRKAQENAVRRDTSRSILEDETESYEKEIRELTEELIETRKSNELRGHRLSELENEACDCKKRQNRESNYELDDSLNSDSIRGKIITNEILNLSNEKQILDLSSELNEVYREHISFQERFSALQEITVTKEKELEDVRNDYEGQNIEIQNYKEKNAELKDVVLATCQDNAHLRNRLEQKCMNYTELKKKVLVLETESVWLREALGIVRPITTDIRE